MNETKGKELADAVQEYSEVLHQAAAKLARRHGGQKEDWLGPAVIVLAYCLPFRDESDNFAGYLHVACARRAKEWFASKDSEWQRQKAAYPARFRDDCHRWKALATLECREETPSPERFWERITLGLPDDYRDVVLAHYRDGLSYPQIARDEGTTVASVDNRLRRALARIRSRLSKLGRAKEDYQ